jgi:PEP-CTERM motif
MRQTHPLAIAFALGVCIASALPASADTIAWTNWTSVTPGSPGTGTGTIGSITVTYSGQTSALLTDYPSWTPTSSYIGGVVGNAPPATNNSIQLEGGVTYTESITFSSPVVDPILAIWSLGAAGTPASFDFTASEPFTVVAGGPSAEYGGSSITTSGNNIDGSEGNGVVQFNGTFSTITFTTPGYEDYYAFTVGEDATLTSGTSPVPEPGTLSLLGLGLSALPLARRKLSRRRA